MIISPKLKFPQEWVELFERIDSFFSQLCDKRAVIEEHQKNLKRLIIAYTLQIPQKNVQLEVKENLVELHLLEYNNQVGSFTIPILQSITYLNIYLDSTLLVFEVKDGKIGNNYFTTMIFDITEIAFELRETHDKKVELIISIH